MYVRMYVCVCVFLMYKSIYITRSSKSPLLLSSEHYDSFTFPFRFTHNMSIHGTNNVKMIMMLVMIFYTIMENI